MSITVNSWYGSPKPYGDGSQTYGGGRYPGTMLAPISSASPSSGKYWGYVKANPDRFMMGWFNQQLLSWLQAIGTDSARVYWSINSWSDDISTYNSSSYNQGTIWEFLGPDYISGAKTGDYTAENGKRRKAMFVDMDQTEVRAGYYDGLHVENWLARTGSSSYHTSILTTYYDRLNYTWYDYNASQYREEYGAFRDWRVVSNDTPGNEFFILLARYNKWTPTTFSVWGNYDEDDWTYTELGNTSFASPGFTAGYRGGAYLAQPRAKDQGWAPMAGWGRIQGLTESEATRGADAGWWTMQPSYFDMGLDEWDRGVHVNFIPVLDNFNAPSLEQMGYDTKFKEGENLIDYDQYMPGNTNRPSELTELPPFHAYSAKYSSRSLASDTNSIRSSPRSFLFTQPANSGQGFSRESYHPTRFTNRWYTKLPIYDYTGFTIGHTTDNFIIRSNRFGTSQDFSFDRHGQSTFIRDGYVWENMGSIAFKTDEQAP